MSERVVKISREASVLVVGAGIMGAGIAQVAAEAGHPVFLFDTREGASAKACGSLRDSLSALVTKGKRSAEAVEATIARLKPIDSLASAASVALVVEAIVEDLSAKRALLKEVESLVTPECVLATNTSSISVTAIANGLQRPERLVGMHFFNPVPLMKLVEVVSGLQTAPAVAKSIAALAVEWGKAPVQASSTPGFIVNRIARPYYAEALALLAERATSPMELDACLKGAGFRMGPCELMDLIGHDTNFAVTKSVFEANFGDRRFVPSIIQRELVDGGLLGRKSGRGFYDYTGDGQAKFVPKTLKGKLQVGKPVVVHGKGQVSERLSFALDSQEIRSTARRGSDWVGLSVGDAQLRLTDGRCASELAEKTGVDVAVFDWPASDSNEGALAWASAVNASEEWVEQAPLWLSQMGAIPVHVRDVPGLIVARTLSMLINEAADAVNQGVCQPYEADTAMRLGVNYPAGPFEWLATWPAQRVIEVLSALDVLYRGDRYRVSPELRRRAWAGVRRGEGDGEHR